MNKIALIFLLIISQACAQKEPHGNLQPLGKFSSKLKEISGMETTPNGNLWVIEDSGNEDKIYEVDQKAESIQSKKIAHAKNVDWEDLTTDLDGNLYIGDFGNNSNLRKDLTIYKISQKQLGKKEPKAEKISFRYPEQQGFPPEKDSLYFDTEGLIHWQGHLYIFTKNRTRPYDGKTLVYRVLDKEGSYEAEFLGSLFLCDDPNRCSVTSADISPDGKTIALLSYGQVFLVTGYDLPTLAQAQIIVIDLFCSTQIESVCFLDNKTLLVADEQNIFGGRQLYRYILD
ncbi:hypothetical protein [Flagellimonas sediminis]|uniref:Uncharacterized protein n=1 Tax=Flagellimonas sediminis TaxID=2696468 RepID=A0A6I5KPW2_9FLAO|nr:hypothetical protein [Allomuricauda sediminis]NDV41719.1 hypothetical protein [Allomuricauda sediminis]